MSRRVTDLAPLPARWKKSFRLDIGRMQLSLRDGRSQASTPLPRPLRCGLPDSDQLESLRTALDLLMRDQPVARRYLDVTISDSLVRCWILKRVPGLATLAEVEALAADQMSRLYGDSPEAAAQWAIRMDATPFSTQWPVIAMPRAWLDELLELTTAKGWQTGKIQTRFTYSINHLGSNPFRPEKNVAYALDMPDGLTIGLRSSQQWLALRTHPPLELLGIDLQPMLQRDCAAAGVRLEHFRIQNLRCAMGVEAGAGPT